jgi:nucleotide-binding universal stress UspA family protein
MSKPSAEPQRRPRRLGSPGRRRFSGNPGGGEDPQGPFADVLCAVDGSRGSAEAVRQAIALAAPGASLGFIAVYREIGAGLAAQADLSEERARDALEEATWLAQQAGVRASTELRAGTRASDVLLDEGSRHDLLAIGCYGGSRIGGIMLGNVATRIAHHSDRPLLVARRTVDGNDFPQGILLATDGSAGSRAAARVAARIAKARRSELRVAHIPTGAHPERRREVARQLEMIERTTGAAAEVSETPGQPAERIAEAARAHLSSLIVIGRRGLKGIKALGSVSERVVHRAPCSVLVVPPEPDGG